MNFRELRKQVFEWSKENFGTEQPPEFPLIGAGEEAGELTTSVLKRAQGIDDSDKYDDRVGPEAEKDAIADIHIYLADFYQRCEEEVGEEPSGEVLAMLEFWAQFGALCGAVRDGTGRTEADHLVDNCTAALESLANQRGYDVETLVEETWAEVSDREWDSDVETAEANILEEANETVGQRAEEYGPPTQNFKAIADMWSGYLGIEITPYDYSQMMILAKIGRAKTGSPDRDTHTDQAGYSLTTSLVNQDDSSPGPYHGKEE